MDSNSQCRICWNLGTSDESNSDNPLVTPCKCSGSQRYVHSQCLAKWISVSARSEQCPSCLGMYRGIIIYSRRSSILEFLQTHWLTGEYWIHLVSSTALTIGLVRSTNTIARTAGYFGLWTLWQVVAFNLVLDFNDRRDMVIVVRL